VSALGADHEGNAVPIDETFGRYRLLERIGEGATAEVFKAKSFGVEGFEKIVCVKRILPRFSADPLYIEAFVREAKLAVRLAHANVVQVFDLGRVEGRVGGARYYIAMEYVAGVALRTVLERCRSEGRRIPHGLAVFVAMEITKALDHAHRRRDEQGRPHPIVHRDLTARNVLVSWEGEIKLTDFGLARSALTTDEASAPTDDLYALGTLLHELLSGVDRTSKSAFEPPEGAPLGDEVAKELRDVVTTALAQAPGDRFPDAARMHEALLGVAYGSNERFGESELAEFLRPMRHAFAAPKARSNRTWFEDEPTGAHDRTPVEVPEKPRGSDSSAPAPSTTHTVVVLSYPPRPDGSAPARAKDALTRHGAAQFEESAAETLAIFPAEPTGFRDTESAVRAALIATRAGGGDGQLAAGVAIARGTATTNAAAEARALARLGAGRVFLSKAAAHRVRAVFSTFATSGSETNDTAYEVERALESPELARRFFGRQRQLSKVGELFALASESRSQFVTIEGPAGIGKSRLLHEITRRLVKGDADANVYVASCPLTGADAPWSGLTAMLRVLSGVHEGDDRGRVLAILPRLRALGLEQEACEAVLSQLGASSEANAARDATKLLGAAFARMIQRLCEDRAHVFAWDDAHVMDAASLATLASIESRAAGPGIKALFVLVSGTGARSALADRPNHTGIVVDALAFAEVSRLIEDRLEVRVLPQDLAQFCLERCQGSPRLLEELLAELVESGRLPVRDGVLSFDRATSQSIPTELRALVRSRIDRLDPKARALVEMTSVFGDPIDSEVLAVACERPLPDVERAIDELLRRSLVRASGAGNTRLIAATHDRIVRESTDPATRVALHARAAAAFSEVEGEASADFAERIAHHLEQSGASDRAASVYARTALRRLEQGRLETAIRLVRKALLLCDFDARTAHELVRWLGALAEAISRTRQAPDLRALGEPTLRRIDEDGSPEERIVARIHLARALASVDAFEDAFRLLDQASEWLGRHEALERRVIAAEMEAAIRQGDFTRALSAAKRLENLGDIDDPRAALAMAHARAALGDGPSALRAIDRAEALEDHHDLVAASEREKQRVLVHIFTRNFAAAVAASTKAVELAREAGLRFETAAALHNLGDASRRLGDLPRAYAALRESLELARASGYERLVALNEIHLAHVDSLRGIDTDAALEALVSEADARGVWTDALEGRSLLALSLVRRGESERARQLFDAVLVRAEELGNKLVADDAREALASLAHDRDSP